MEFLCTVDSTLCSTIDNYKLEVCNIYGSSPFPLFETSEGFLCCRKGYNSYAQNAPLWLIKYACDLRPLRL